MTPALSKTPLRRYMIVDTRDPEEMRHAMLTRYGAGSFAASRQGFEARGSHIQLDELSLGLCAYGSQAVAEFPEADFARLQIGIRGVASTKTGGVTTDIDAQQGCVLSAGRSARVAFGDSYEQLVLRISEDSLRKKLTAALGFRPRGGLVFAPALRIDAPQSQGLLQLISFCCGQIDQARQTPPPLVVRELEQCIMMSFLYATRHSFSHLLDGDAPDGAPCHVRCAEEFIEANWQRAIEIDELTRVTGVGARTLSRAFLSHRGHSPHAFAKQVRMRHAKTMLEAGDNAATVTSIAFKCGFGNLGHFARDYCETYGELPSATLDRAQRLLR